MDACLAPLRANAYAERVNEGPARSASWGRALAIALVLFSPGACSGTEAALVILPADTASDGAGGAGGAGNPGPNPGENPLFGLPSFRLQLSEDLDLSSLATLHVLDAHGPTEDDFSLLHEEAALIACYFSAGSFEPWRPDAAEFSESDLGNPLSSYPDERWLDITSEPVAILMAARMDAASERGCDAVYPSVVRPTNEEDTGFTISLDSFRTYEARLAQLAKERGLQVLYAGGNTYDAGASTYDGAVVFGCVAAGTCASWAEFALTRGVFSVEIGTEGAPEDSCGTTPGKWPVLVKAEDLGAFSYSCPR